MQVRPLRLPPLITASGVQASSPAPYLKEVTIMTMAVIFFLILIVILTLNNN